MAKFREAPPSGLPDQDEIPGPPILGGDDGAGLLAIDAAATDAAPEAHETLVFDNVAVGACACPLCSGGLFIANPAGPPRGRHPFSTPPTGAAGSSRSPARFPSPWPRRPIS